MVGCRIPAQIVTRDSNLDLRPVTQMGFQSRFSTEGVQGPEAPIKIGTPLLKYDEVKRV